MRVTTGEAKGRRLASLPGEETRPTSDMLKQAIFSSIQFEIYGRRALDLFAGTGQLGIEAISRGAKSCVFVERNPKAAAIIKQNLQSVDFTRRGEVKQDDALSFILRMRPRDGFNLVLIDPPYRSGMAREAMDMLIKSEALASGAIVAAECAPDELAELLALGIPVRKQAVHGRTAVAIFELE